MPIGTPFHERTAALNTSLAWREWSGYFAASHYREFHQPEYAAIRNGIAVIDVSPLFKYTVTGPGAQTLLDRVVTRDVGRLAVGQVGYTPWCDGRGKVLQEGTIVRWDDTRFTLNATEPTSRWLQQNADGLDVEIIDRSADVAVLALQGPGSRALIDAVCGAPAAALRFFRATTAEIDGVPVEVTRTGYTGDLGYEVWIPADRALAVWDAVLEAGRPLGAVPCGLMAMDIARIEAGFVLLGVDYVRADRAVIPNQLTSPDELGLGWAVDLDKPVPFVGRDAIVRERETGRDWDLVGLVVDWEPLERLYTEVGLMPDLPLVAWRDGRPILSGRRQVGRATSGCWSTLLKKYLALASIERTARDAPLEIEVTVDYVRKSAPARVVELPFFRPPRMRK